MTVDRDAIVALHERTLSASPLEGNKPALLAAIAAAAEPADTRFGQVVAPTADEIRSDIFWLLLKYAGLEVYQAVAAALDWSPVGEYTDTYGVEVQP